MDAPAGITASADIRLASYLRTAQGLYQITAKTSDTVVTIATPSTYVNETSNTGALALKLKSPAKDNLLVAGSIIDGTDLVVMRVSFASHKSFFTKIDLIYCYILKLKPHIFSGVNFINLIYIPERHF